MRFAAAAWPLRAAQELRSALVFRALARAARAAGMADAWSRRFESAVRDELRHAQLCAAAAASFGAERPPYDPAPVKTRLSGLPDPLLRTVALLLVEIAMGETVSMLLFREGHLHATEPFTRATLGSILRDEARHQRLGWQAFTALRPRLDDRTLAFAQREASLGLAACERQNAVPAIRWLQSGAVFDPAYAALGVLPPESRIDAFYRAVEKWVIPRLSRMGLDGPRAWSERYRPSLQST